LKQLFFSISIKEGIFSSDDFARGIIIRICYIVQSKRRRNMKRRMMALLLAVCMIVGEEGMMLQTSAADVSEIGTFEEISEETEVSEIMAESTEKIDNEMSEPGKVRDSVGIEPEGRKNGEEKSSSEIEEGKKQEEITRKAEKISEADETEMEYIEDIKGADLKTSADGLWGFYLEYGKATVVAYYGNETTVTMPSKIDGAEVTAISYGFGYLGGGMGTITSLVLPNTITYLPKYGFQSCRQLVSITLSDKITSIPEWCFIGCSNLQTIKNYSNVTSIDNGAFTDCSSLKEFDFSNIEKINKYAPFSGCSSLTSISFSGKLKEIPFKCFQGCSSLKSVVFREGLENIGGAEF
jgi:hypothetical protein